MMNLSGLHVDTGTSLSNATISDYDHFYALHAVNPEAVATCKEYQMARLGIVWGGT
jgi:hypothetical protein